MHVACGENSDVLSYWREVSELLYGANLARDTQSSWVPAHANNPRGPFGFEYLMKTLNEKSIRILNDLIDTCKDGQMGFATAAKDTKDPELGRAFSHYAAQRGNYIRELQQRVRSLGGNPDKHGSVSGSLHRGWMNLKAAITSHDPHAILSECEQGEDAAVRNYRDALQETDLDSETRALIQRQTAGVQEAHDRVKELRDSVAYAHR